MYNVDSETLILHENPVHPTTLTCTHINTHKVPLHSDSEFFNILCMTIVLSTVPYNLSTKCEKIGIFCYRPLFCLWIHCTLWIKIHNSGTIIPYLQIMHVTLQHPPKPFTHPITHQPSIHPIHHPFNRANSSLTQSSSSKVDHRQATDFHCPLQQFKWDL